MMSLLQTWIQKQEMIFYRLLEENEKEKISLFVTHRLDEVKDIVNRQIYMDLGRIVSDEKV